MSTESDKAKLRLMLPVLTDARKALGEAIDAIERYARLEHLVKRAERAACEVLAHDDDNLYDLIGSFSAEPPHAPTEKPE